MNRKHIVHEYVQINRATPERVYPLLCPVREAEWVPGWRYSLLFSESGYAEPGCVFTTSDEDGTEITWICTHRNPEKFEIGFVWVKPEMIATRITIQLTRRGEDETQARIRYEYTGLSDAGDLAIAMYDRAWFENKMQGWEKAINYYLANERCLPD